MDKEIIFLVEESSEGGYEAKALGYSIYTEADELEGLKSKVKEAVECHFEGNQMPHVIRLHMVKDEVLAI
ncbi:MAG: 2-oxoisovalerate dehydrogenase [Candidatus Omnitrophica bacterium]|nr:2-oxoisovalerate dehydrogenase [Candidatus Omnitrophota bacterium]MBU1784277.1 2-oxoisovalerate dehydrogenase [Candidatus Omnitrophota bacterium]